MGRLPTELGARPAGVGGLIQEQDLGEVVAQPRPGLLVRSRHSSRGAGCDRGRLVSSATVGFDPSPTTLWRGSGGVGCGLHQRGGEEALHRVEWLGALVGSAQDKGALESCEEYGGVVLCG
jgi:hypothetical protein